MTRTIAFLVRAALVLVLALGPASGTPRAGGLRELRAVAISAEDADVYASRASIAEALDFLARHHVNVVHPSVWHRGTTIHPSAVLRAATGVGQDPRYAGRDPLAELIVEAHRRGIEVVPWLEQGFAASERGGPATILASKPGWAARDRSGAVAEQDGLAWTNAFHPDVQAFVRGLVLEIVRGYDVDGIACGGLLPAQPATAGYDDLTTAAWRAEKRLMAPVPDDPRWMSWRAGRLTDFLALLARDVRATRRDVVLALSPAPVPLGFDLRLQDARAWLGRGLVDVHHPQCHRRDLASYARLADAEHALLAQGARTVFAPSILVRSGSWTIDADELVRMVEHGRARGFAGELLEGYAALRADDGRIARALLAGPYADGAGVPHRSTTWRPRAPEFPPRVAPDAAFTTAADHVRADAPGAAEVVYSLAAGTPGWYRLFVEFPRDVPLPGQVVVRGPGRDVEPVERVVPEPGLVRVADVRLSARTPTTVVLATDADADRPLVAGRAVLILDRRRSPDALWRE